MDNEIQSNYEIRIDFERHTPRPSRVFHTMSGLIETFDDLDRSLLFPFRFDVEPILLLEDVQSGSLKARLASVIRSADDEAIKNLDWKRFLGKYLVDAKYWIVKKLEGAKEINSRAQLLDITEKINRLAQDTDVLHLPAYQPVSARAVLYSIKRITKSLSFLKGSDEAEYITPNDIAEFNTSFEYREEMEETLLTDSTSVFVSQAVIKVKKPDFLGESMWEFKHQGHQVRAKMSDHNWLLSFQTNRVHVLPGDALRVTLETTTHLDEQGLEIGSHFRVLHVDEIIRAEFLPSDDMFEDE